MDGKDYQALIGNFKKGARRIGLARMQENIAKLNYGNLAIGNLVDTFWLNGQLKISAVEQTRFLAGLAWIFKHQPMRKRVLHWEEKPSNF